MKKVLTCLVFLALSASYAQSATVETSDRTPSIELSCKGAGAAVFYDTGEIVGDAVNAEYVDFVGNTLYFTNDVRLVGTRQDDNILFDTSTLVVGKKQYACTAH